MKTLATIIFILIVYTGGFLLGMRSVDAPGKAGGPGTPPADVFHDDGEWFSQDGCWHLQDGYWRPLRRCHIVRVPADSGVSWAAGQEGPTYRKVGP